MIPSDRLYTFAALRPFLAARVPCNYTAPVARERRTYKRWLLESRGKRRALTFERQGSRSRFLFALRLVLSFAFSLDSYTQRALRFPLILFFFCGRWFGKEKVPGLGPCNTSLPPPSMAQYIWYLCINKVVFFYQSILILLLLTLFLLADFLAPRLLSSVDVELNARGRRSDKLPGLLISLLSLCIHTSIWIRNVYMHGTVH